MSDIAFYLDVIDKVGILSMVRDEPNWNKYRAYGQINSRIELSSKGLVLNAAMCVINFKTKFIYK